MPLTTAPGHYQKVYLLIDKSHLDLAREVICAGDPGLAMEFTSTEDTKIRFKVNDVPHVANLQAEPVDSLALELSAQNNFFWLIEHRGPAYPEHDAYVSIGRNLGENLWGSLLALTEVVNALVEKIPVQAIWWLPGAVSSVADFKRNYDNLYARGMSPILTWLGLFGSRDGMPPDTGKLTTIGLRDWGLPEISFQTPDRDFDVNTNLACDVIDRMIRRGHAFPDGTEIEIDWLGLQGSIKLKSRTSEEAGVTICDLEFSYIAADRPAPGVH